MRGQNGATRKRGVRSGRSAPTLVLRQEERAKLERLVMRNGTPLAVKRRSKAILACALGKTNTEIAEELGVTGLTVGKWRTGFLRVRLRDFEVERRGRPFSKLVLSRNERKILMRWMHSEPGPAFSSNAKLILGCAAGKSDELVAEESAVSPEAVGKVRRRFVRARINGITPSPRGRSPLPVCLEPGEQEVLEKWSRLWRESPVLAKRASVILASVKGHPNVTIAEITGVSQNTVGVLRKRFLAKRLDGLNNRA